MAQSHPTLFYFSSIYSTGVFLSDNSVMKSPRSVPWNEFNCFSLLSLAANSRFQFWAPICCRGILLRLCSEICHLLCLVECASLVQFRGTFIGRHMDSAVLSLAMRSWERDETHKIASQTLMLIKLHGRRVLGPTVLRILSLFYYLSVLY